MTPQSQFMVLAPVTPGRERSLRELLATMNCGAGHGRPGERGPAVPAVRTPALCAAGGAGRSLARRHRSARRPAPEPAHLPCAHRQLRRARRRVHGGSGTASGHRAAPDLRALRGLRRAGRPGGLDAGAPRSPRRQLHQLGRSHGTAGQGGRRAAPRARREGGARAARFGRASPAAPARADRLRRCRGERRAARLDAAGPDAAALAARKAPASPGDSAGGPRPRAVPDRPVAAPDLPAAHEGGERRRDLPAAGPRGAAGAAAAGGPRRDQPVHGDRLGQAGTVSPLARDRAAGR